MEYSASNMPLETVEDVLIKVKKFIFSIDFIILDMKKNKKDTHPFEDAALSYKEEFNKCGKKGVDMRM